MNRFTDFLHRSILTPGDANPHPARPDEQAETQAGHGHPDGFAVSRLATVIEIILVVVALLLLDDGRRPRVAACPLGVAGQVQVDALIFPLCKVGRREHGEIPSAPSRRAVGGGVDIIAVGLVRVDHLRVGVKSRQNGVSAEGLCGCLKRAGSHCRE